MNGCAIVSLAFLSKLHHVYRRVSQTHSIAMKGKDINEAGAFRNL